MEKNINVSLGYASQAGGIYEEEGVSGDTAFSCRLPDGSRAVILSDGMGHGSAAAAESRAAAGLLRRLLKQGMACAQAVKEVNRYLLERCRERESFATVDLTVISPVSGRARFYKMGAAPSYIIGSRRVRKIQQPALPAGVLPSIRLSHVSTRLAPGDIIVMMSDGISDSGCRGIPNDSGCRGTPNDSGCRGNFVNDWMISFLNDMIAELAGPPGPRKLASAILAEARRRYGGAERDDATVIVIVIR